RVPVAVARQGSSLALRSSPPLGAAVFPYTTLFRSRARRRGSGNFRLVSRGRVRARSGPPHCADRVSERDESPDLPAEPSEPLARSEEHTSELQSPYELVCRLLLEKKNNNPHRTNNT